MSWLKKRLHTAKKSIKRMSQGKFHLGSNWIKSGGYGASPFGPFLWNKKWRLARNLNQLRIGKIKKQKWFSRYLGGSGSGSIYLGGDSYMPSNGYQYSGRSITSMY